MVSTEHRSSHMVAWAIPVHTGHAPARLEAYVLSKPTILTLALCIKNSGDGCAMGRIPQEILLIITYWLREDLFGRESWDKRSLYSKWNGLQNCLEDQCCPSDHWTMKECLQHLEQEECGPEEESLRAELLAENFIPNNYGPGFWVDTVFDCNSWCEYHRWEDSLDNVNTDGIVFSNFALLQLLGLRKGDLSSTRVKKFYKVGSQAEGQIKLLPETVLTAHRY